MTRPRAAWNGAPQSARAPARRSQQWDLGVSRFWDSGSGGPALPGATSRSEAATARSAAWHATCSAHEAVLMQRW